MQAWDLLSAARGDSQGRVIGSAFKARMQARFQAQLRRKLAGDVNRYGNLDLIGVAVQVPGASL